MKKLNPTPQKHTFTNQKNVLQYKINKKELKPGLGIRPGNETGLFSKGKLSNGGDK